MLSSRGINIFMCVCCICFVGAQDMCGQQYRIPKWEPQGSVPPGNVKLDLVQEPLDSVNTAAGLIQVQLEAQLQDIRENFNFILLANPFINDGNCPPANSSYLNLRKFYQPYIAKRGDNESKSVSFGKISTGCYYAQMTNAEGKKWLQDPVFYNTSYDFYDTMIKCSNYRFQPANYQQSMQLKYDIEIPLTCLRINCKLFELNQETNNTEYDLDKQIIPETQDCDVINNGIGMAPLVKCSRPNVHAKLSATIASDTEKSGGWKTIITWDNLEEGGASYYTSFTPYTHRCNRRDNDLRKWEPVFMFGALSHGFRNETNTVYRTENTDFPHTTIFRIIIYTVPAVIVTAIMVYWMWKYANILLQRKNMAKDLFVKLPEIEQLYNENKANRILLIYAKDSPVFITEMDTLRNHLQQICNFPVHDLYSNDDLDIIMKLGATGWIENLLKDGSKVILVDTPQFRAALKDYKSHEGQEKQYKVSDFRDEAIPYAVTLVTSLFQNNATQYRCYFVVRLKEFQVDDGNDDPLQVVSPHARYYIPEHLSLLCEHVADKELGSCE